MTEPARAGCRHERLEWNGTRYVCHSCDEMSLRPQTVGKDGEYLDHPRVFVRDVPPEPERVEVDLLRESLFRLMEAVEAHKRYWPRVDWTSERCERAVFAALAKGKEALDATL